MKSAILAAAAVSVIAGCAAPDTADKARAIHFGQDCRQAVESLGTPQTTQVFSALGIAALKTRFTWFAPTRRVTLDCVTERVWSVTVESHFSSTEEKKDYESQTIHKSISE